MRFKSESNESYRKRISSSWFLWFAWYPIRIGESIAWLEYVERKTKYIDGHGWEYYYRYPGETQITKY